MPTLPCPPAHWPAFSRRLDALLTLPPAARSAALDALPADEQPLRPWLAAVLARAVQAQAEDFLAAPRLPAAPPAAGAGAGAASGHPAGTAPDDPAGTAPAPGAAAGLQAGQRIGPYALLRELGRGGMGVVWLARRADGAYQRELALKLPHAHLLAGALRERFARERDLLARLTHPHIARFYDAGLAEDGQPYLALEAVHGQPITDWCRTHQLDLAGRLALFDQVAAAVAHAHGRLVAHRDLKPANVLVTAEGEVKLLDFGIARLLHGEGLADGGGDGDGPDAAALTRAHGVLATPQYAAPEQLAGGPVSVATDVYALGLMLFELLTDQPALAGARRDTAASEPPLPSRAAATPALRRQLQGDLDAIVAQALQPAPEARYPSVAALAEDLRRHRDHRPIRARRLGPVARLRRFVRRHRLPVALGGALAAALLAGVAGVLWQAQEARTQARRAEAVKDFLLGVFRAADPRLAADRPSGQTPAKTLLDRAAARIDARFADDPALHVELLRTAADIYRELGEDRAYQALQARQLALVRQHHGPLHEHVLDAQLEAALQAYQRGELARCRQQLADSDRDLRAAGRDDSLLRAHWWLTDGLCRRDQPGQGAQRLAAIERALAQFERLAPGQRGQVTALLELATEHSTQMRLDPAIAANRRAIALAEALPQRNEAELQTAYANLGLALQQRGDLAAAAQALGRAADIAERTSGADFRTAWQPRARHARTLHLAGERAAALPLFEALLARLPPPAQAGPDAHAAREDYGERLAAEGRPALGLPLLQAAEQGFRRGAHYEFDLRRVRRHLGDALDRLGRHGPARQVLLQALREYEAHEPPARQPMAAMRERWARFLLDQGELAAAQAQFQRVVDEAEVKTWAHVALARAGLARVALARGEHPAALRLSAEALAGWDALSGFRDLRMRPYLQRVRAAALAADGQHAAARALREAALAASRRYDAPDSPSVTQPDRLQL